MRRREGLVAGLAWPWWATAAEGDDATKWLRAGGVVLAFRHALAPGTFDPPEFRLGDCRTQRNLNDEGRAQARRIGQRLQALNLTPTEVRSSPWCRCMDTATLAFGRAEAWDALGSPRGTEDARYRQHQQTLREALVAARSRPGRFDVWVTHMFVLSDLVGRGSASGEGLVLQADADGRPQLLARLAPA